MCVNTKTQTFRLCFCVLYDIVIFGVIVLSIESGKKIQRARKAKNLTQKQLAEILGLATGTVQQYELGKRQPPLKTVEKIADVLSVSPFDLVGDSDEIALSWLDTEEFRERCSRINPLPLNLTIGASELSYLTKDEVIVIGAYRNLTAQGQEKLRDYMIDLLENPKYTNQ